MAQQRLKTLQLINAQFLGRKRAPIELISEDQDFEEELTVMPSISTETTADRDDVIFDCAELYEALEEEDVVLMKDFHRKYLDYAFEHSLPPQMKALDASQPWILYWIACALRLMNKEWLSEEVQRKLYMKLSNCSLKSGPFCGGYGQQPHLICNYAAINALALCDNVDDCWSMINKEGIYNWLLKLKTPNGGFRTGILLGECDTRSTYCALSVASMLDILTPELTDGVEKFLLQCQTYEGGFGACPQGDEAHGGYTFCAIASLAILNSLEKCNIGTLLQWCSARQTNEEKGLSGRSNKLVDGCYSYWVGAVASILEAYGYPESIDKAQLKEYILKCCQTTERPGLRDKPGKAPDYYHTAYVLMGFSITEHAFTALKSSKTIVSKQLVPHPQTSAINPVYGLPIDTVEKFADYLASQ